MSFEIDNLIKLRDTEFWTEEDRKKLVSLYGRHGASPSALLDLLDMPLDEFNSPAVRDDACRFLNGLRENALISSRRSYLAEQRNRPLVLDDRNPLPRVSSPLDYVAVGIAIGFGLALYMKGRG